MNKCPVCNSETEEEYQKHCNTCAWELEWFLGDLSEELKKEYSHKLKIHKKMYLKSIQKGNPGDEEPPSNYFGLRYLFVGIYLFVKYFIKFVSWLILLGLLVGICTLLFKEFDIVYAPLNNEETGILVGFGIFVFITGIYMYKKFTK